MKKLVLTWLLGCFALGGIPVTVVAQHEPYIMGILPRTSAKETHSRFLQMARYLSAEIGREVRLETARDFESFWRAVATKRYDIVHFNQLHYIKSKKLYGYDVILKNEENGKVTIAAAIATIKSSDVTTIAQLSGKTISFGGGNSAMVSYIAAKYLLAEHGLASGDYKEEFSLNPPNALLAVYYGQADAAGVGDVAMNMISLSRNIDVDQIVYLAKGEDLPQLPWATKGTMPTGERMAVTNALLRLNTGEKGKQILNQAGLTGLRTAVDADYDICRTMVRRVTNEQY